MKKIIISVIIIAKNEAAMIGDCLQSAAWADELILVDNGSTDQTVELARRHGARVLAMPTPKPAFSQLRNLGLEKARGHWLLYLDADERITPELKKEVRKVISQKLSAKSYQPKTVVYEIPRRNFYLGQEVHYGGAWPDYVKRLFFKNTLQRWERDLHEDPVFAGQMGTLRAPLVHLAHRDLSSMIAKTSEWSQIEANLLFQSGHPPVTWWRLLRPMLTEFWQRGVVKQGWRDGPIGWIEVIFQAFSRFITYARLWEMQQKKL